MYKVILSTLLMSSLFLTACAKLSVDERNAQRQEINQMADSTIKELLEENPEIKQKLKNAKGYAVINWKVTKVPLVGAGSGIGVIFDLRTNEDKKVYIDVSRFDIGLGWGARAYKNLVIINDSEALDRAIEGDYMFQRGTEVSAGTKSVNASVADNSEKKATLYVLMEGGGSATSTIRLLHLTPNEELN